MDLYPKKPPAGIVDTVTTFSDWKRKFAWVPVKINGKSVTFRYYYERQRNDDLFIFGTLSNFGSTKTIERAKTLFDVLKS